MLDPYSTENAEKSTTCGGRILFQNDNCENETETTFENSNFNVVAVEFLQNSDEISSNKSG